MNKNVTQKDIYMTGVMESKYECDWRALQAEDKVPA